MKIDVIGKVGLIFGIFSVLLLIWAGGTYINVMSQTKNCTSYLGTMDGIGYAQEYTFEEQQTWNAPNKNVYVTLENGSDAVFHLNLSYKLEEIEEVYPIGKSYIFTLCNNSIRGFTKNDWSNRQFYHKYRKAE